VNSLSFLSLYLVFQRVNAFVQVPNLTLGREVGRVVEIRHKSALRPGPESFRDRRYFHFHTEDGEHQLEILSGTQLVSADLIYRLSEPF